MSVDSLLLEQTADKRSSHVQTTNVNLLNAQHMYTCDFCPKKCLFLWDFFTDMGLEWSQDWIYASTLVKNASGRRIFD